MSTPVTNADDSNFRRMLFGFGLGALGAIALVIVIAYLRGVDLASKPLATDPTLWPAVLSYAIFQAAPLGAIYMAIASISLLRSENLVTAALAIFVTTAIISLVGEGFVAPLSPLWIDASVGFWIACIAINVQRKRRNERSGWESYFS
jgi:hypothetical protein